MAYKDGRVSLVVEGPLEFKMRPEGQIRFRRFTVRRLRRTLIERAADGCSIHYSMKDYKDQRSWTVVGRANQLVSRNLSDLPVSKESATQRAYQGKSDVNMSCTLG